MTWGSAAMRTHKPHNQGREIRKWTSLRPRKTCSLRGRACSHAPLLVATPFPPAHAPFPWWPRPFPWWPHPPLWRPCSFSPDFPEPEAGPAPSLGVPSSSPLSPAGTEETTALGWYKYGQGQLDMFPWQVPSDVTGK